MNYKQYYKNIYSKEKIQGWGKTLGEKAEALAYHTGQCLQELSQLPEGKAYVELLTPLLEEVILSPFVHA